MGVYVYIYTHYIHSILYLYVCSYACMYVCMYTYTQPRAFSPQTLQPDQRSSSSVVGSA